ncbi:hypothetical protein psyc5s11_29950 [Clostridium gelidum]|uniref:Uncharacterized protein n=1 Tax=Clostridium gelidum TaxID=704125 RepID=A0ABM7T7N0_9CLOT|nr:hypothetical protein [Clostridium gelidum]BCZ46928.1 hypothetical protein psyc5s11_29950 [Clostridium gelidum]
MRKEGLPKYIVNFDELAHELKVDLLNLINSKLNSEYPQLNTDNLESLLGDIRKLLPYEIYRGLKNNIDSFIYSNIEGIQKVEGRIIDVPPLIMKTTEIFQFEKDVFITGLHINQTGWKINDTYSLEVMRKKLITNAPTKEVGEHKYFNTFHKVLSNIPIYFNLDNKSGNSRQVILDLEYIEGLESTIIDTPITPTINDIKNDWDIAVVMNWESGSLADIDLHGFIGNKHIYFSKNSMEGFYLNFDFQSHVDNTNPEIISIKGFKGQHLDIYANNYNGIPLTQDISIKIYNKKSYGTTLLKNIDFKLDNNGYLNGICSIDLNTQVITNLVNQIKTINGGI